MMKNGYPDSDSDEDLGFKLKEALSENGMKRLKMESVDSLVESNGNGHVFDCRMFNMSSVIASNLFSYITGSRHDSDYRCTDNLISDNTGEFLIASECKYGELQSLQRSGSSTFFNGFPGGGIDFVARQKNTQHNTPDHNAAGDGYGSVDFVAGSSSSRERKKGVPWTEEERIRVCGFRCRVVFKPLKEKRCAVDGGRKDTGLWISLPGRLQAVKGKKVFQDYAILERRPLRQRRLPCSGIGIGWLLFIIGFIFAAIPWYGGAFILIYARYDDREKPGYIACLIAAIIGTIAVIFCVTGDDWDRDWKSDWIPSKCLEEACKSNTTDKYILLGTMFVHHGISASVCL
ncbi:hypothetical protein L2E82_37661 [Cichorium intybus]|uniref:Uncharacterized protein n=1 Tax=Cichorium intybus TaxID=13427 RepID=A0ACB9AJ70_CICIN|nr:hypothetical protein L2E82_37661 [Cichorium intybus]